MFNRAVRPDAIRAVGPVPRADVRTRPTLSRSASIASTRSSAYRLATLFLFAFVLIVAPLVSAQRQEAGRFYPETGFTMAAEFISYYDTHGGLPLFGYPITAPQSENDLLVQYFERERFEYHPEHRGTDAEVLLGRLGAELVDNRADGPFKPLASAKFIPAGYTYMPLTGHTMGGEFADYWNAYGGLAIFGYPISEEFVEDGIRQQWFERARFEFHREQAPQFQVLLGLLGRESLRYAETKRAVITVADGPATPRHLQVDLSQGGESLDPAFLHNVVPQLRELNLSLIRIDNIYTHYNVVGRDAKGSLTFDWSRLDAFVDDILATGARPFMNLSYMPPVLSGYNDNIHPPQSLAEWRQVVDTTVRHYNGERNLGLHYWEVWNEPDLPSAWSSSLFDYLQFYDETRRAVRGADPIAIVGGPALSIYSRSSLDWLASYQPYADDGGYLGFLSWHAFGTQPGEMADHVRQTKEIIASRPGWAPEIMVNEINVKQGGPGDTSEGALSDTSAAAAHIFAALAALEDAGADRALIFEAKDGEKPGSDFWGRWGILTFDGQRKPSYWALHAYKQLGPDLLPVGVTGCDACGLLASPTARGVKLLLWNNGADRVEIKLALPPSLTDLDYTFSILDGDHNNPRDGDPDTLTQSGTRSSDGLVFAVEPRSALILDGDR